MWRGILIGFILILLGAVSWADSPDPSGRRPVWLTSWAERGVPRSVRADHYPVFPPPREMKLGKASIPLNPAQTIIVTGSNLTDREQRAVEILKQYAKVVTNIPSTASGTRILIGQPSNNPELSQWLASQRVSVTPTDPGPQGYVIRTAKDPAAGWTIALAGSDDTGVLYAAQSFAQLVLRDGKGARIRQCSIRDWPGTAYRMIGYMKPMDEFYPALRSNVIYDPTPDPPTNAKDLGRNGVLYTSHEYWTLQGLKTSKPRSERTSCWTDEAINKSWLTAMSYIKSRATILFTHEAHDSGWWWRYLAEVWVKRCDECRAAYPDDDNPAQADADRWNSWIKAVRETDPKGQIIITLPNYYDDARLEFGLPEGLGSAVETLKDNTDPRVRATVDRWKAQGHLPSLWKYLEDVGKLTDEGILFCTETSYFDHGPIAAAYQKHLGHPVVDYTYSADGYTGEPFTNNYIFAKACSDSGVAGGFFNGNRPLNVTAYLGYAWNPDLPQDMKSVFSRYLPSAYKQVFGDAWREMLSYTAINPPLWADSWDPEALSSLATEGKQAMKWLQRAKTKAGKASIPIVEASIADVEGANKSWESRLATARIIVAADRARMLSAQGKPDDARKALKDMETLLPDCPVSQAPSLGVVLNRAHSEIDAGLKPESRPAVCSLGDFDFSPADTGSSGKPVPPIGPGALDSVVEPDKRSVTFTGDLSKGGRLILQYRNGTPLVRLDGLEVISMPAKPRDWVRRSVTLPSAQGVKHTLELIGGCELDALAVYAGAEPVTCEEPWDRQIDLDGAWRVAHATQPEGLKFGWDKSGYNDSAWRILPATMKSMCWAEVPATSYNFWWRKTVTIPADWTPGSIGLRVGFMNGWGRFYVNGNYLGDYGWSGEGTKDISPYVRLGKPNTIAVFVSGDGGNAFATGISLVRR